MEDKRLDRLFEIAHQLFPVFYSIHKPILGGRQGIMLAIHSKNNPDMESIDCQIFGHLLESKKKEKIDFAREKILRMKQNGECCSFLSERVSEQHFGGGIEAKDYWIAPSGFPPHLDQKFALMLAHMADEIDISLYHQITLSSLEKVNEWRVKNGETQF